jgi:hypothetical protein
MRSMGAKMRKRRIVIVLSQGETFEKRPLLLNSCVRLKF